jgi:predicted transcriptional regulator
MKRYQFMPIRWFLFINRDRRYRHGTERERRMIELKISAACALNALRRKRELTQQELAQLLGISQARVSKMEQIKAGVSLDMYVEALLSLGANDTEIARALNAGECHAVKSLRERAALPFYPKASDKRPVNDAVTRP